MVRKRWKDTILTEYQGKLPPVTLIQEQILSIEDDLTRIFCILSYLTGGRIGEIVNYRQERWIKRAKRNNLKQTVKDEAGNTIYEWVKRDTKGLVEHRGITKKQIKKEKIKIKDLSGVEKEIEVLSISMINEKNKTEHTKLIYAPYYFEGRLIDELFTYLDRLDDNEVVVDIDRRKMYRLFIKYAEHLYYPHFIRALRVGVLLEIYNFQEFQIQSLMGWSDIRPLKSYYIFKKDKTILTTYLNRIREDEGAKA
jgi:hypothetical protein